MSNTKKKLTDNWAYKLTAILSALLLWTFITISENPLKETGYTVSVELRGLAANLSLDNSNYQIYVRVQGPTVIVNDLRLADIVAYADFSGAQAGDIEIPIMVAVPDGLSVLSQSLKTIKAELKEKRSELFHLQTDLLGEPASGFIALLPVLSPAEVRLWGTEDYIRRVDKVFVAASIQDIEESYEKDLSIMVLDNQGNDISAMFTIEPKVAKVVVPVVYEQPERMVAVRVPVVGEPALGYQLSLISVTPQTVRVFGDLNRLQSLYYVETEPVDVSGMSYDDSVTVNLDLGNGFSSDRKQVTVALQIEPVNYATYTKTLLLSHNVGEGLIAEVEQPELSLTVYGPETFIATLDEADIVPYVDCGELEPGIYNLPIRVAMPNNIMLMNISENNVEVRIYDPAAPMEDGEQPPEQENIEDMPE